MPNKKYVGWIYIEREPGFRDRFFVHVTREGEEPLVLATGSGPLGAVGAVEYFEKEELTLIEAGPNTGKKIKGLGLGSVKLEQTPLGLRVFVEEMESKDAPNKN